MLICMFVQAQNQQLITYHGQFRTIMNDSRLKGNILDGDTVSPKRGAVGTAYFDFGINVAPNEDFKILAEFRMRNIIGQDEGYETRNINGTGTTRNSLIDTRMIFRQVRAEGRIKDIVDYQIGDIDMGMTKYTLFNNDETYHKYESDIFKQRRVVSQYENFQFDNKWRVQGLNAKATINARKIIRSADLSLLAARTRMNNLEGALDRLLVGFKVDITQSKYLKIGGNVLSFYDLPGTSLDTLSIYKNNVFTTNYEVTPYNSDKIKFQIEGENGVSSNSYYVKLVDVTAEKNDYFIDFGTKAWYKPMKTSLKVSYVNVGHNFTSPGAQTLKLRPTESPLFFNSVNNLTTERTQTLYDRFGDETVYNQRINPGLMVFLPVYGNVLPYGSATPNRNGIILNLDRTVDTSHVVSFSADMALLTENVSEGDSTGLELRKFSQLQGGVFVNVAKLIGFKKALEISFGARLENTTRGGAAAVDFSSTLIDAGVSVEVLDGVYLQGGIKQLTGKGNEVLTLRNTYGSISGYTPYLYDLNQSIVSAGVKLDLFTNSFASFEYNTIKITNNLDDTQSYTIGNLFVNFTLRF